MIINGHLICRFACSDFLYVHFVVGHYSDIVPLMCWSWWLLWYSPHNVGDFYQSEMAWHWCRSIFEVATTVLSPVLWSRLSLPLMAAWWITPRPGGYASNLVFSLLVSPSVEPPLNPFRGPVFQTGLPVLRWQRVEAHIKKNAESMRAAIRKGTSWSPRTYDDVMPHHCSTFQSRVTSPYISIPRLYQYLLLASKELHWQPRE
jgi:hypothetical protein